MEEAVDKCASLLLEASSPEALIASADFFEGLSKDRTKRWSAESCCSRIFQELLAYKRGALVDHLLRQMLTDPGNCDTIRIQQLYACRIIVTLSESEAVAKYCAKDEQRARPLAKGLLEAQAYLLRIIPGHLREKNPVQDHKSVVNRNKGRGKHEFLDLALENIRGFANFLSVSKPFRLALQQSDGFFRDLESLVARNVTKRAGAELQEKAVKNLCRLLHSLSRFRDTQDWAIDSGLVRIHAAAARLVALDGVTEGLLQIWKDAGIFSSAEPVPNSKQMRKRLESTEKTLLRLDRCLRNSSDPRTTRELRQIWLEMSVAPMEPGLLGEADQDCNYQDSVKLANALIGTRVSEAPIVCSWEECNEGSVLDAGRQFSKCANCSLAFYCSKEHQKRHWRMHKKQCTFKTSDNAPPHGAAGSNALHFQLLYSPE